ncbi:hypothetical protein K493DRAFT_390221, partial [Basidiobolus meristosporus CBS 931.73]
KICTNHIGHTSYINTASISPNGSLCTTAGKDIVVMLWDLNNSKHLYSLEASDISYHSGLQPQQILALCFCLMLHQDLGSQIQVCC